MTTFADDIVRLKFDGGTKDLTLKELGLSWPPPERITVYGFDMLLVRCSQITDAQRRKNPSVIRGAEYVPYVLHGN